MKKRLMPLMATGLLGIAVCMTSCGGTTTPSEDNEGATQQYEETTVDGPTVGTDMDSIGTENNGTNIGQ